MKSRQTHYPEILNRTFILLRTKPHSEAMHKICGEGGLCHTHGLCSHPSLLSFFWWMCAEEVPGFIHLPCVQDHAKKLGFHPENGALKTEKNTWRPLTDHLQKDLFSRSSPQYMRYMFAKILSQSPQNALPDHPKLYAAACKEKGNLCRFEKPEALPDSGGHA